MFLPSCSHLLPYLLRSLSTLCTSSLLWGSLSTASRESVVIFIFIASRSDLAASSRMAEAPLAPIRQRQHHRTRFEEYLSNPPLQSCHNRNAACRLLVTAQLLLGELNVGIEAHTASCGSWAPAVARCMVREGGCSAPLTSGADQGPRGW